MRTEHPPSEAPPPEAAALAARADALLARRAAGDAAAEGELRAALARLLGLDEAAALDCLLRAWPAHVPARIRRAELSEQSGDGPGAVEGLRRALALDPAAAPALWHLGRLLDAEAPLRRALALDPGFAAASQELGMHLLLRGRLAEGWPHYEGRRRAPSWVERAAGIDAPEWEGGPLAGRDLLLVAEQGRGDAIQFVRYAEPLARAGARVHLRAPGSMLRLLSTAPGVSGASAHDDPPPAADLWAYAMSVPLHLTPDLASIPARPRYLSAEPARVARWRARLAALPGLKVGLAWQGNPEVVGDRTRSVPPVHAAALAALPGVGAVSLQRAPDGGPLPPGSLPPGIHDLGPELDAGPDAFLDTAAVIACLDLVVTSDTAIAHLAGALGAETWVALRARPDWRWLLDREDSPWYPTMRLFRQGEPGDWAGTYARVAAALRERAAARA
jgi:tetratricopeptide (TPR) repeat protein